MMESTVSSSCRRGGTSRLVLAACIIGIASWAGCGAALAAPADQGAEAGVVVPDRIEQRLRDLESLVAALRTEIEQLRASAGATESVAELERRIEVLTLEIERMRIGEAAAPEADEEIHGFGPAASKVYRSARGVSIGGYGEMLYQGFDSQRDDGTASGRGAELDFVRAVFYFGYKFNDRFLFNSEIEYEHALAGESKDGEVAVEFAYIDFRASSAFGARGGLLLMPIGFLNELHEPPIFHGSRRPDVERFIIPTTWRENGAGVYGQAGPFTYKAYLVASLDALGFSPSSGIRGGRQNGSKSKADDFALTARLDYLPAPGLIFGASVFSGGLDQDSATLDGSGITLWDAHAEWNWRGLHMRGLYARSIISDTDAIGLAIDADKGLLAGTTVIGERQAGWYGEIAWNVLSAMRSTEQELSPFMRYEWFDTQDQVAPGRAIDPANDRLVRTFGLTWKPIPFVAVKIDYQNRANGDNSAVDQFNVALGYLF